MRARRWRPRWRRASGEFAEAALRARLETEWLDLTLPAPGPRRGHLHPITRIQRELEELFASLGFAVLDGPEVETEYHNFDALNIPRRPSRARHAGHLLAGWRQPAAHAHFAGAGARHGAAGSAAAHDRAGSRVPQRERGRLARAHLLSARRHDDRSRRFGGAPALFHEDAAHRHLRTRGDGAAAAGLLSVRRAGLRAGHPVPDLRRARAARCASRAAGWNCCPAAW